MSARHADTHQLWEQCLLNNSLTTYSRFFPTPHFFSPVFPLSAKDLPSQRSVIAACGQCQLQIEGVCVVFGGFERAINFHCLCLCLKIRGPKRSKSIPFLLELAIFRRKFMDPGKKSCEKKKKHHIGPTLFFTTKSQQHMLFPNLKTKKCLFHKKNPSVIAAHTQMDVWHWDPVRHKIRRGRLHPNRHLAICAHLRGYRSMDGSQVSLFA